MSGRRAHTDPDERMTIGLLLTVAGLAAVDSLNPATIGAVLLVLLLPTRKPVASALGFVAGAFLTVVLLGTALFLAADAAADSITGGLVWVRRIAFGLAALGLVAAGLRRLRPRHRRAMELPAWFSPLTAVPLGAVITGVDLPNAFPYFIAIERLVTAEVDTVVGLAVLIGYAAVYCLPCLVLLALGRAHGDRVRGRLQPIYDRFGTARHLPRSIPTALGLTGLAGVLVVVALPA
jgi:cytochrome c biogenesis protein CcdA